MDLILLSAGRGSRLSKKLRFKPKSLAMVNNKAIIEHNILFFNKFKKKYIITGYRKKLLSNFAKKNNFKIINNHNYKMTNMVYSMFLASRYVKQDVLVCYGDIIFDPKIYNLFKSKENIIPLNSNWLKIWKKRMSVKHIKKDAENLNLSKNYLTSIGGIIKKKFPKYQYMGVFKLKKKSFFDLKKFFVKINNNKIDMTTFINLAIKNNKLRLKVKKYNSYWYEIDNEKDLFITSRDLKK